MKNIKKNGGFTLVELIVVIAILAILAAVAIPAYSGYIEKAKKAGDEQLLAAVNKAFASACVAGGSDMYMVTDAGLEAATGTPIKGITTVRAEGNIDVDEVRATFKMLFVDQNASAKFEVIQPVFVAGLGFVDMGSVPDGMSFSVGYGGGVISMNGSQVSALQNSTYLQNKTTEDLMYQINDVATLASGFTSGGYTNILTSDAFQEYFSKAMGVEVSGLNDRSMELAEQALKDRGIENPTNAEIVAETNKMAANAMVLYTAQQSADLTTEQAQALLNGTTSSTIIANMTSTNAETNQTGLTQAALAYGMYYAYINSNECKDASLKNKDIDAAVVIDALDKDTEFQKYISGNQGITDMNGYLNAMQIISSTSNTTGNESAVEDLITNGFNNEELLAALGGLNVN